MQELAELSGHEVPVHGAVWDILTAAHAERRADTALTVCEQKPNHLSHLVEPRDQAHLAPSEVGCLSWSYDQLMTACVRVSRLLLTNGVQRGSKVIIWLPTSAEWAVMMWVAQNLQLTCIPLDYRMLTQARKAEVTDYIELLQPAAVVTDSHDRASIIDNTLTGIDSPPQVKLVISPQARYGWFSTQDIQSYSRDSDQSDPESVKAEFVQDPAIDRGGSRVVHVMFTSGTSAGKPKGCPTTVRGIMAANGSKSYGAPSGGQPRVMITTGSFRPVAWALAWMAWMHGGSGVVPSAEFDWKVLASTLQRFDDGYIVMFPAHVAQVATVPDLAGVTFPLVRDAIIAGDVITLKDLEAIKRLFPNSYSRIGFGMTEASNIFDSGNVKTDPPPTYHGVVTVGPPSANVKLRICDENRRILQRGEVGELHLCGPQIIEGYLGGVNADCFYKDHEGDWFVPGDRALLDRQGLTYILGRSKDDIKKAAMSLSAAVPEALLNKYDGIESIVIGVPSPLYGEEPAAVLKSTSKSIEEGMGERIKKIVLEGCGVDYELAGVYLLSDLGFEDWPVSANGKVIKRDIKAAVFVAQLASTHQLHCIEQIRHYLHHGYYFPNATAGELIAQGMHVDHCLEVLQLSTMCSSGVSLTPFYFATTDDGLYYPFVKTRTYHQCANWERIEEWSKERTVNLFNPNLLVLPEGAKLLQQPVPSMVL